MRIANAVLPCVNSPTAVSQIQPTIELITELDLRHPDILTAAGIDPKLYHGGMVLRSAIETIRGQQAARQTAPREAFVSAVLGQMHVAGLLQSFEQTASGVRWDFEVRLDRSPIRDIAIEVKGGEGNSLNISNRPDAASEFVIWCHLDGSLKNSPAKGTRAILGRIIADIIKAPKRIDALIIRDALCGSAARPCPKYANNIYPVLGPAPDIFLFPMRVPIFGKDAHPPIHTEASCVFPFRLLHLFGVPPSEYDVHVHYVDIRLFYDGESPKREVIVTQAGVEQFRNISEVRVR